MKIEVESEALDSLKAMAQRLQEERDELLEVCMKIDADFDKAKYAEDMGFEWIGRMRIVIAKCTKEPEVM